MKVKQQEPTPKYYETTTFSKLNEEWKNKLKASGFNDIEKGHPEGDLESLGIEMKNTAFKTLQQTEEYYDLVCWYLHYGVFKNARVKRIWELHSEGKTMSEIGKEVGLHKTTVFHHVKRMLKKAKGL